MRQEGIEKGRREAELEMAQRMLDAGSELVFIAKVTGLSTNEIKALQKK
ncbi:hypothetical protein [Legionella nautarum]|nr:hypothetical protein [Legionella nautarum]